MAEQAVVEAIDAELLATFASVRRVVERPGFAFSDAELLANLRQLNPLASVVHAAKLALVHELDGRPDAVPGARPGAAAVTFLTEAAAGPRRRDPAPRRRPPVRHPLPETRPRRPRPWLCGAGLPRATGVVRRPPRHPLVAGRTHRPGRHGPALRPPPFSGPRRRLPGRDARRTAVGAPTWVAGRPKALG